MTRSVGVTASVTAAPHPSQSGDCLLCQLPNGLDRGEGIDGADHVHLDVAFTSGDVAGRVRGDARSSGQDANGAPDRRLLQLCSRTLPLRLAGRAGVTN